MEKWNFDFLFEGTHEERLYKVSAFSCGLSAARDQASTRVVIAVAEGDDDSARARQKHVDQIDDLWRTFDAEPRLKALKVAEEARLGKEANRRANKVIAEAITEVFGGRVKVVDLGEAPVRSERGEKHSQNDT